MKKIVCLIISVVLAAFCFGGCTKAPEFPDLDVVHENEIGIVVDGKTDYDVVLAKEPTPAEAYAAEELVRFFKMSTGIELAVTSDAGLTYSMKAKHIVIGNSAFRDMAGVEIDFDELYTEGFVIKNVGNSIYLSGADERGTLYSVYDFLEKFLGVMFLAPEETHTPKQTFVKVKKGYFDTEIPALTGRDSHYFNTIEDPNYAARMRMNGVRTPLEAKHGYGSKRDWSQEWSHTWYALVPPAKYYDAHPEWYDYYIGVPHPEYGVLVGSRFCLTNEALRAELVENLKTWIIEQPEAKYFAVAQEDNCGQCTCEKCQASDSRYTFSGTVMRFVNAVARDIKAWGDVAFPGREIYIETFAYQTTTDAPCKLVEGEFVPLDESVVAEDNVIVRLTAIWNCFSHALDDKDCAVNTRFNNSVKGYSKLCDKLIVWSYCTNFSNYLLYFNNFSTMADNIKLYQKYNIFDALEQGTYDVPYTDMQELRVFLHSKLMWNPDRDVYALIDEFVNAYYGVGGKYVRQYIDLMETHFAKLNQKEYLHFTLYDANPEMIAATTYPRRLLEQAIGLFDKALAEIKALDNEADREKYTKRIVRVSLSPRYLVLINYMLYYDASTKDAFVDSFFKDAENVGITKYKEWMPMSQLRDIVTGNA